MPMPSTDPLRRRVGRPRFRRHTTSLAIGGAGSIAVVHALAAKSAGWRTTAVASAGGRSARHLAGQLDARPVRPEQLPAGADVLVVASPPDAHVDLALRGIEAGALVLVEKPLATTLADADRLVEAVDGSTRVRVAENLLHSPAWRRWREERPALGQLGHLSARALQPSPDWGHFARPLSAGGVLFDLGPHPLALALESASSPVTGVRAELASDRDDGADDRASVEIDLATGTTATVELRWGGDEVAWDVQAAGADGSLRLELLPNLELTRNGQPLALTRRHDGADHRLEDLGYVDQLLDLVDDPDVGQDVESARRILEVICAAYTSAGTGGTTVPIPFDGDRAATPMQLWRA